jgi:hypothetical protein
MHLVVLKIRLFHFTDFLKTSKMYRKNPFEEFGTVSSNDVEDLLSVCVSISRN